MTKVTNHEIDQAHNNIFGPQTRKKILLRKRLNKFYELLNATNKSKYNVCCLMDEEYGLVKGSIHRYFRKHNINFKEIKN